MELGSLSRLLLAKLATELRGETVVGRADPSGALGANGTRSTSGALPQPVPSKPEASAQLPAPSTTLTPTGQLVARLLRTDSGADPSPAIATAQPIVDATGSPDQIAQTLARVVTESGLFYESHLLEWTQGKRDLDSLLREPQARLPDGQGTARETSAGKHTDALVNTAKATHEWPQRTGDGPGERASTDVIEPRDRHISIRVGESGSEPSSPDARNTAAEPRLSADAARIVRHQLDALAAEQIVWRGALRPGEPGEIEIGRDPHATAEAGPEVWRARLALELPQLGRVEIAIALDSGNVALAFRTGADSRAELARQAGALQSALAAQALRVQGMQFLEPRPLPERVP